MQYRATNLGAGPIHATLLVSSIPVTRFGDTAEQVLSIAKPSWITGGKWTYSGGEYHAAGVSPRKLSLDLQPNVSGLPLEMQSLVSGKSTYARLGLQFNITAPLDTNGVVTVDSPRVEAQVKLLDRTVFQKGYLPPTGVSVTGTLNSKTLNPQGLSVRIDNPVTLASGALVDTSVTIPVIPSVPGTPELLSGVS